MATFDPENFYHQQLLKGYGEQEGMKIIKNIGRLIIGFKECREITKRIKLEEFNPDKQTT